MKIVKGIMEWLFAATFAFVLINLLCFIYERPVAWIDRENGVTEGVRRPYSTIIHGTEGYGITKLDKNGFANEDKNLIDKDYILVMGSSHTQGKEVSPDEKYTYILNKYIAKEDEKNLHVYNVASDGNFLPSLLQRFKAGVEEFPNSKMVIMEIGNTDYSIKELEDSLNQKYFTEDSTAEQLFKNESKGIKVKNYIKEYFPVISLYKNNFKTSKSNKMDGDSSKKDLNIEEYSEIMDKLLQNIRKEYNEKIVFVYHPNILIEENGSLLINKSETYDTFLNLTYKNNIDLIDLSDTFLEYYNSFSQVPYGFWNTQMGAGHLNKVGHKIFADEIYKYIKEVN